MLQRAKVDQDARRAFAEAKPPGVETPDAMMRRWQPVKAVDDDNTAWVRQVIAQYGWPGRSLVGEDGAHALWLLVQHGPPDLQEQCLPLLERAVEQGEAGKLEWAYLLDRVLIRRGEPQVYGTQFTMRDGVPEPHPIRDSHEVGDRRAEIGLEPMAEYAKRFR